MNTQSNDVDDAFLNDFTLDATPEELEVANPRFAGIDANGEPFEILAKTATRLPEREEVVALENPRAVTEGPDEKTVVIASKGVFRQDEKILDLNEKVTLEHRVGDDDYVLRTPAATVLLEEKRVVSTTGVDGADPGGNTLRADRMEAFQADGRIVFQGNVKMRIHQQSEGLRDTPAEGASAPSKKGDAGGQLEIRP